MRTHLDYDAVIALKLCFAMTPRPSQAVRQQLAVSIGVPEKTVTVWFQNRRQRSKARDGMSDDRGCPEACKLLFQDEGESTPWWESGLISALTMPGSPTSITHDLSHSSGKGGGCDERLIDTCELLESVMYRGAGPVSAAHPPWRSRSLGAERPVLQLLNQGGFADGDGFAGQGLDDGFNDGSLSVDFA